MKKANLFLFFISWTFTLFCQGVAINNDGSFADESSILDIQSTSSGVLLPRLTELQKTAITTPAHSLIIFNTDTDCFEAYNSNLEQWVVFACIGGEIPNCGEIDAGDGNFYQTVIIGSQCWMRENLKYLPSVSAPTDGAIDQKYYYVYGYDGTDTQEAKNTANYQTHGVLYNKLAAETACPTGWHLPTLNEWQTLAIFLGGAEVAGSKLKDTGNNYWQNPNTGATNTSFFTALASGMRDDEGYFDDIGKNAYWWTNDNYDLEPNRSLLIELSYDNTSMEEDDDDDDTGFAVRCVKN